MSVCDYCDMIRNLQVESFALLGCYAVLTGSFTNISGQPISPSR